MWSYPERGLVSEFETVWDMGGTRLCLVPSELPLLVAAAYHVHGIAGYDATSGSRIWQRRDLKKAQNLCFLNLSARSLIGVGFEKGPFTLLDPATGRTVCTRRGYKQSAPLGGGTALLSNRREMRYVEGQELSAGWAQPVQSFALLDAAGSPDQVVASEANGPLRAFARNGEPLWEVKESEHFVEVVWHEASARWIARQLNGKLFAVTTEGSSSEIGQTPWGACAFLEGAQALASRTGEVIAVPSCDPAWRFVDPDQHRPWATSAPTPDTVDVGGQAPAEPRPYSPSETFCVGDVVNHSVFGQGDVVAAGGGRISVRFADGVEKQLAQRKP